MYKNIHKITRRIDPTSISIQTRATFFVKTSSPPSEFLLDALIQALQIAQDARHEALLIGGDGVDLGQYAPVE